MTEIIDLKAKRGERERAAPEKSFSEIEREFDEEIAEISCRWSQNWASFKKWSGWLNGLTKRQRAKRLLEHAAKAHDLAKLLLEAAIREEEIEATKQITLLTDWEPDSVAS